MIKNQKFIKIKNFNLKKLIYYIYIYKMISYLKSKN